jgi:formylmethanofuran:tetrahydromethanopterin formyltransferase
LREREEVTASAALFGEDEPMQLMDLLPEESLALVALSRAIARADGTITPLEGRAIAMMAAELGEATYRGLFAKAAASFADEAALRGFLESIERPEARALIYETILALASADSISAEEEPLMAWLQEAWKIQ